MGGVFRSLWRGPTNRVSLPRPPDLGHIPDLRRRRHRSSVPIRCDIGCQYLPTPQLCDLVYELEMVDWHQLGVQLEIPPHRLDKIEEDYRTSERRLCKVLEYWLTNEMNPSWDKICEALRRMGGFVRIVRELKLKYCSLSASEFRRTVTSITCARCNQHHCKFIN